MNPLVIPITILIAFTVSATLLLFWIRASSKDIGNKKFRLSKEEKALRKFGIRT